MKDSYAEFFNRRYISKEQFFEFGLEESIYISFEEAKTGWNIIKDDVLNNRLAYIRGYGRNGLGTKLFIELYKEVLGNQMIQVDPSNNTMPERVLNSYTNYRKNIKSDSGKLIKIQNYQISHIFGKTKNPFLFTAPWNIAYIPKIIDPFTGHEARGDLPAQYTRAFRNKAFELFGELIEEYNQLIVDLQLKEKANSYIDRLENKPDAEKMMKFRDDINNELSRLIREH